MLTEIQQLKDWKRRWMPFSSARGARLLLHMLYYHDELLRDFGANPLRKRGILAPLKELFVPYQLGQLTLARERGSSRGSLDPYWFTAAALLGIARQCDRREQYWKPIRRGDRPRDGKGGKVGADEIELILAEGEGGAVVDVCGVDGGEGSVVTEENGVGRAMKHQLVVERPIEL